MDIRKINDSISVSPQIKLEDAHELARLGFKSIISNRPDGEENGQPTADMICMAAEAAGLEFRHIPVVASDIGDRDIALFDEAMKDLPKRILAFCRSGTRAATLWALSQAPSLGEDAALSATKAAGYDLSQLRTRLSSTSSAESTSATDAKSSTACDVLIVGAGAAGIATAASLLKRRKCLSIVLVDPSERHAYQPGWTMVGGGIFKPEDTVRPMRDLIPDGVKWEKASVAVFEPDHDRVVLSDGRRISYRMLVAAPGIKLSWSAIEGLEETLGRNGVTSNYRYDIAPLYLVSGPEPQGRSRPLHPTAHADQMRRSSAKSDVSVGRSLVSTGPDQRYLDPFPQCRTGSVRCEGLCAGADGVCKKISRQPELRIEAACG